jgi:hypothetical protein
MRKAREVMPNPGNRIHIPLPEKKALDLLMKVRPSEEMPRQKSRSAKLKKTKRL